MKKPVSPREVLFEFTRIGQTVRVTAIDAETGTEAVIQGSATMPPHTLQKTALAKLDYVMGKKSQSKGG